jgi:periplasmic divalent cation tolerance protein
MIYIFWTCANKEEAQEIIRSLLDQRLIACASFHEVQSLYRWEGKIEEATEIKVFLKTQPLHFSRIEQYIQTHSSYAVSEIAQVEATHVHAPYLAWVQLETSSTCLQSFDFPGAE